MAGTAVRITLRFRIGAALLVSRTGHISLLLVDSYDHLHGVSIRRFKHTCLGLCQIAFSFASRHTHISMCELLQHSVNQICSVCMYDIKMTV